MRPPIFRLIPNLFHRIIYSPSTVVQLLLDKVADIWKEGLYDAALGAAAFAGDKAIIEQLLGHGTNKNLDNSHRRNALP